MHARHTYEVERAVEVGTHPHPTRKKNFAILATSATISTGLCRSPARFDRATYSRERRDDKGVVARNSNDFGRFPHPVGIERKAARGLQDQSLSTPVERAVERGITAKMREAVQLWESCSALIRAQVSDAVWNTTFHNIEAVDLTTNEIIVVVPSQIIKERIEARYLAIVRDAITETHQGPLHMSLQVRADDTAGLDEQTLLGLDSTVLDLTEDDPRLNVQLPDVSTIEPSPSDPVTELPGRPPEGGDQYTFDAFVTGTGNRFAHAAALSVAETPAKSYNPLFIYGDAGLGKTHLLRAIENYVNTHYPHFSVRYVSTETFLNEFVDAIRQNTTIQFKRRYREIDVLLVDDIQFVEGKEGLQEEFFHTFNTLHQANRQIVLTCDRPPDSIPTLEDRLRSRFKMGLITDIQPPDVETRLAILHKKAENAKVDIPHDVLMFIAERVKDNIRELEGALTRVTAFSNLTGEPLTIDMCQRVLSDLLTSKQPRQITPAMILTETADMFGFTIEEIIGASRRRPLVTARQVAMYVFREATELSYPAIAREFGGRDHTTVIHAVDKISNLMAERRQIYDQVTELNARLRSS